MGAIGAVGPLGIVGGLGTAESPFLSGKRQKTLDDSQQFQFAPIKVFLKLDSSFLLNQDAKLIPAWLEYFTQLLSKALVKT